ncbi:hypothetical protein QO034_11930 [Sedimentitalea sp. JM2-8]|uniref:Uncharacterized protein n=1 Tax=Sedimentitalea xiamensis TaxID=3050037 RepID=A0ABT7FFB1_9RHOB|nr:hypothetical protein [Sedimentitalea xiamensis]MDK3073822.1 hypothetical protein [Sedimentitalea xiamensis]
MKPIHDKLQELKAAGLSMIIDRQNFGFATFLADDVLVVGKGRVVWTGSAGGIRADEAARHTWPGV